MNATKWNNRFSVGIERIDDQHKVLFNYIADLEKALGNPVEKQRWSTIHYVIVQLRDYARIHFAVEECLMEILSYPGRDAHIQEHGKFVSYLLELEHRSITHNNITELEIIEFLRDWLMNHITVSDKEYSRNFSETVGAAPQTPTQ